jgi:hypothetical protein
MRQGESIAAEGSKAKAARAAKLSLLVWVSGFLGFLVVSSGFRLPARMLHLDELLGVLVYGTLHATPAVIVFWALGVPALAAFRSVSRSRRGSFAIVCGIVCCALLAGSMVILCTVMPGCSPKERVTFGILYGLVGLAGGLGYAWIYFRPSAEPSYS